MFRGRHSIERMYCLDTQNRRSRNRIVRDGKIQLSNYYFDANIFPRSSLHPLINEKKTFFPYRRFIQFLWKDVFSFFTSLKKCQSILQDHDNYAQVSTIIDRVTGFDYNQNTS